VHGRFEERTNLACTVCRAERKRSQSSLSYTSFACAPKRECEAQGMPSAMVAAGGIVTAAYVEAQHEAHVVVPALLTQVVHHLLKRAKLSSLCVS
jgi:hypothetical protein